MTRRSAATTLATMLVMGLLGTPAAPLAGAVDPLASAEMSQTQDSQASTPRVTTPPPVRVEHSELLRLLEDSGVERQRASAGVGSWARDMISRASLRLGRLMHEISRRFEQWLVGSLESLGLPSAVWLRRITYAIAAATVGVLLLQLLRFFAAARGRARRSAVAAGEALPPVRTAVAKAAGEWRSEAERHLADGRIADALEAIWWWLACSLVGERADPSWTGRELLIHAGRRDLAPAVQHLEAMTYGPARPALAEVRSFLADLAGALR